MPEDPGNWGNAAVIAEQLSRHPSSYPKGLLDFFKAQESKPTGSYIENLKDRGYDSIFYPNESLPKHDSFMVFDPKNIAGRFTPKGQEIIDRRGIHDPALSPYPLQYHWKDPRNYEAERKWKIPRGILKKWDD